MSGQKSQGSSKCDKRKVEVREMCRIKVMQGNARVTSWLTMTLENSQNRPCSTGLSCAASFYTHEPRPPFPSCDRRSC